MKYLRGVKGTLVQAKKKAREKAEIENQIAAHNAKSSLGGTGATLVNGTGALRPASGNLNTSAHGASGGRTPQGGATPQGHRTPQRHMTPNEQTVENRLFAALGNGV